MRQELSQDRLVARLDRWVGHEVSVRVVTSGDELLATFRGTLGERSSEKHPGLFWPISGLGEESSERPGIYLHPELFEDAAGREGQFVLELRQAGTTLNIRRL